MNYLAKIRIEVSEFMEDDLHIEEDLKLVSAENLSQAQKKIFDYYRNKSLIYNKHYNVLKISFDPEIV